MNRQVVEIVAASIILSWSSVHAQDAAESAKHRPVSGPTPSEARKDWQSTKQDGAQQADQKGQPAGQGLQSGAPSGKWGDMNSQHEKPQGDSFEKKGGISDLGLSQKAPRGYGDTYGGEKMNNSSGSGGARNFSGGGIGHKSDHDSDLFGEIAGMLTEMGGKTTGDPQKDAEELAYAMSVGESGWAATKDMGKSEREAYWRNEANRQLWGSDRPREDYVRGSGPWRPFGTGTMKQRQLKFIERAVQARQGAAGGANDGRGDRSSSGGGTQMVTRNLAGGAVREGGAGQINWDAVFRINQQINPAR